MPELEINVFKPHMSNFLPPLPNFLIWGEGDPQKKSEKSCLEGKIFARKMQKNDLEKFFQKCV